MAKPSSLPRWATDGAAQITVPSSGAQDIGHAPDTALTAQLLNWFWNLVYLWIAWFDMAKTNIDTNNALIEINAILGPATTIATGGGTQLKAFAMSLSSGRIVGVGVGGAIKTSDNLGVSWTSRTADASYSGDFNDVVYDVTNGVFIACGTAGEIQTSPDGVTWTQRTSNASGLSLISLATDQGMTVAFAISGGVFVRSTNAATWVAGTPLNSGVWEAISVTKRKSAGLWAVVGAPTGAADRTKSLYTSTDGSTWSVVSLASLLNTNEKLLEVHSLNGFQVDNARLGLLALVVDSVTLLKSVIHSEDGATWTRVLSTASTADFTIATGNYGAVLVPKAGYGKGFRSKGGQTWDASITVMRGLGELSRVFLLETTLSGISAVWISAGSGGAVGGGQISSQFSL